MAAHGLIETTPTKRSGGELDPCVACTATVGAQLGGAFRYPRRGFADSVHAAIVPGTTIVITWSPVAVTSCLTPGPETTPCFHANLPSASTNRAMSTIRRA